MLTDSIEYGESLASVQGGIEKGKYKQNCSIEFSIMIVTQICIINIVNNYNDQMCIYNESGSRENFHGFNWLL
jgi:hypothetical protein